MTYSCFGAFPIVRTAEAICWLCTNTGRWMRRDLGYSVPCPRCSPPLEIFDSEE